MSGGSGMNRRKIGIVADDITGSNDVGVMLAKNGFVTTVVSQADDPTPGDFDGADALIINTASRLDDAQTAAEKTRQAARFLKAQGCGVIGAKTCSVFRGNIGAALDAVQDVTGAASAMVIAAFPRNGRTTLNGVHFLNGVPISETHFAHDPVTPIHDSRLDRLIARQSERACGGFAAAWLDEPPDRQRARLDTLKRTSAYVIFDARDQTDLRRIAGLIADEPCICGSSAIWEELPAAWGQAGAPCVCRDKVGGGRAVVIMAGSLTPQTAAQAAALEREGVCRCEMDAVRLLEADAREQEVRRACDQARRCLEGGQDVLLRASSATDGVRRRSAELGLDDIGAGRAISLAFEMAARILYTETGQRRYAVAGGETSDAVSRGLGVRAMRIGQEIEAGVPLMTARAGDGTLFRLVLKSGSFGSEAFLCRAAEELRHDEA